MDTYALDTEHGSPGPCQQLLERRARRGVDRVDHRLVLRKHCQAELLSQTKALRFARRAYWYSLDKDHLTWDFKRRQVRRGEPAQLLLCSRGILTQNHGCRDIFTPTDMRHRKGHCLCHGGMLHEHV